MMRSRIYRLVERTGTSLGIAGLLALGFLTGGDLWTVIIEPFFVQFDFFEGEFYVGLFTVVITVTGFLLGYDVWFGGLSGERLSSGPTVRTVIPAYRDADVVDESVTSLLDNEYDPLEIVVVVEPNDEPTQKRARELADRHETVTCLVNDSPGSKATAINCAVERGDADYFVVFDADERASPEFVSTAMGELTGDVDVFQGRRVPRPTGPVETLAYCERVAVQAGYLVGDLAGFTHCQSSATGFTREAFDAVGGFVNVLTEDIYFSHQVHRADLSVTVDRQCTSSMEAPHTISDLWGQRKRWRIGHVEVCKNRIHEVLKGPGGPADLVAVGRALGAVLAGGILLVLTAQILMLLLLNPAPALVSFGCIFGMIASVWSRDLLDGRVGLPSWTIVLAPLVYLGHGVLTVKAVFEYALTWNGEWYQVTKTGV